MLTMFVGELVQIVASVSGSCLMELSMAEAALRKMYRHWQSPRPMWIMILKF